MKVAVVIYSRALKRWWLAGYYPYEQAIAECNRFLKIGHKVEMTPVEGH